MSLHESGTNSRIISFTQMMLMMSAGNGHSIGRGKKSGVGMGW